MLMIALTCCMVGCCIGFMIVALMHVAKDCDKNIMKTNKE